jgi:hypothetical protein
MQWGAIGAWQPDYGIVVWGEQRQDQLLDDQPPAWVIDRGEVESPTVEGHLDREPDHVGESHRSSSNTGRDVLSGSASPASWQMSAPVNGDRGCVLGAVVTLVLVMQ